MDVLEGGLLGKFYRRVALPEAAKVAEAEARYANGVLTVTVPKGEGDCS
jgi:HSP20 family molecular chaperone IbpA